MQCKTDRIRPARGLWPRSTRVFAAMLFGVACLTLLPAHRREQDLSVGGGSQPVFATEHKFVITIVSASRGGMNYLANTLQSLHCAIAHNGSRPPPVLVVNTEVPPQRHVEATALSSPNALQLKSIELTFTNLTYLHSQLHTPGFVLQLVNRTAKGYKVCRCPCGLHEQVSANPVSSSLLPLPTGACWFWCSCFRPRRQVLVAQ